MQNSYVKKLNNEIFKAFMSVRVGSSQWLSEERFVGLMKLLNS
jgi:hypothetical protein